MSDLLQLRGEIDRIDREIVRLFEQRMEVTDEVGRYKIENGKKVFDREREREKIETAGRSSTPCWLKRGPGAVFPLSASTGLI